MSTTEISILRCNRCNKPFDKESSLKRHGYYCKAKRSQASQTRARSCIACAKAKQRCEGSKPACTRCMSKVRSCHYPVTDRKRASLPNVTASNDPTPSLKNSPSSDHGNSSLDQVADDFLEGFVPEDTFDFIDLDFHHAIGAGTSTDLDISNLGLLPLPCRPIKSPSLSHVDLSFLDLPSQNTPTLVLQSTLVNDYTPNSIPHAHLSTTTTISRRPSNLSPSHHRTASLLRSLLRSYPLSLLKNHSAPSWPPFIHPLTTTLPTSSQEDDPLAICLTLLALLQPPSHIASSGSSSATATSKRLFWRNVAWECTHLSTRCEATAMNKWEILAAMQALCIYLLIRLDENDSPRGGENMAREYDPILIRTVVVLSRALNSVVTTSCHLQLQQEPQQRREGSSLQSAWHSWIFTESVRRLCIVYQVVNLLVYFTPAALCDLPVDLVLAPLPGRKVLWEASGMGSWDGLRNLEGEKVFGMDWKGNLVLIREHECGAGSKGAVLDHGDVGVERNGGSNANWEEWCADMDGFGGLVMLAASMITG